jgi:hypothetical protein
MSLAWGAYLFNPQADASVPEEQWSMAAPTAPESSRRVADAGETYRTLA